MEHRSKTVPRLSRASSEGAKIELPDSMRNNVAVLDVPNADGSSTKVYLIGVSHVSKVQAEQVEGVFN